MTPETSIYLHIPFCKHRCAYCDFNTYAGQEDSIPAYVDALINEIEFVGHHAGRSAERSGARVHTVFFGGGTPSLLSEVQFEAILQALRATFTFTTDAEISIEANPGTISPGKLNAIRAAGVNRISFGVQSANTEELRMLERAHDFFTVIEAVSSARKAGFDNLNLDLIYGLPEQSMPTWQTTLKRVLELHPEHISAYALTLEHGTPFGKWSSKGLLPLPDPDLAADMYEWACEYLEINGYVHYEISNWAKNKDENMIYPSSFNFDPFFACRHNLQYWRSLPYLAFGTGAHGYAGGYRYSNALRIKTYMEHLTEIEYRKSNIGYPLSPAAVNQHKQTLQDDMSEYMLNNLRLVQAGVVEADFRSRFGRGLLDVYPKEIDELIHAGLLECKTSGSIGNSEVYRLTKRGRLLGNQAFIRFIN
ncbi:MAG: radical SAM family heme chaperone HemW [Anaerolineaceae bacterium]|nr:MAG: radical SAM family heme chaperone HemW [Anaerolineaceae bacterium]